MTETLTLTAGDETFEVHVARPDSPPRGALVVIHEIWGLVPHIDAVAARFAGEGYSAHDPALIEALPRVTDEMSAAGVAFETVVYPEAAHAFFNDTGRRYDPDAAADAWRRVTGFFAERLA